ncbi:MAG: hypothetical protein AAF740_05165 [Bacteroidota bacterium]
MSTNKQIISAPIVATRFIKKNGVASDFTELYVRRSIQDYYIKFCESDVQREEIEAQFSNMEGEVKVLTLEVEFREGS